ncbi:50S ribosomal protein L31 [Candidatus Hodgkinia cicadicola]
MKKGVHPKRYKIKVTCTDGSHFLTKSTTSKSEIKLEMDTKTHPAWTKKELAQDSLLSKSLKRHKTKYKELPSC